MSAAASTVSVEPAPEPPIAVIGQLIEANGYRLTERATALMVKAFLLGFALGRDAGGLHSRTSIEWHVNQFFPPKRRRS